MTENNIDPKMEAMADKQHQIWSAWMKHLFSCCEYLHTNDSHMKIPGHKVKRWSRQLQTPYEKLSEEEKQSDRDVVTKFDLLGKEND